jgi:inorganic triphosphatase YgiF
LLQEGDAAVELVLDTGHIQAGDRSQALCEIELELKHGPVNALFALARRIDGHVPVRIGMRSKSERGYGLNDEMPAAFKAEPVALAADSSIADAFARIAAACLRQYRLNEQRLLQGYHPAALHQARVAVRRMRSALTVFRPVLDRSGARRLGAELRWLAGVLGEARDLDVLLAGLAADHPQRAQLEEAQGAAQARVLQWLESARVRRLMLDMAEWLALDPVEAEAGRRPAAPFAARRLTKYRRRVVKGGRGMKRLSDEARHAVRKDAKKLRYGAEFLAGLFNGKKARRRRKAFIGALEGLQDDLGALNDLASAPAMLARHGAGEPAAPASEPERAALLAAAARGRRALADAPCFWT